MYDVKELTLPREGLHGMMQCYRRQHFVASNDLHEPLESYFGKYAQEIWERNWMDFDMHTLLLDRKLLKPVEYVQSDIGGDDSEETS